MSLQRTQKRQRRLAPRRKAYDTTNLTDTQVKLYAQAIKDGPKAEKAFFKAHESAAFRNGKLPKMTPKKRHNRSLQILRASRLLSSLLIRSTGAAAPPLRLGEIELPKGFDAYHQRIAERGTTISKAKEFK